MMNHQGKFGLLYTITLAILLKQYMFEHNNIKLDATLFI